MAQTSARESYASYAEIAAAVSQLADADTGTLAVVEPIARQLPGAAFAATVEKHGRRCSCGNVANPTGLLIHLLETEIGDETKRREAAAAAAFAALTPRDHRAAYVRSLRGHPRDVVRDLALRHFAPTVGDDVERAQLERELEELLDELLDRVDEPPAVEGSGE